MTVPDVPANRNWWEGGDALLRFVVDLITAEARHLRPASRLPPTVSIVSDTRLDEAGLGFDSLERLQIAAALSEALHFHEGGLENHLLEKSTVGEWCEIAVKSLARFSAFQTFRTSGSTGIPKSCSHPLAGLEQEVGALLELLPNGRRILAAVPCHHIYGFLFTVLLPRRLGNVPVLDVRGHAPEAIATIARQGDIVIGHPAFWAACVRAASSGWSPGVTGVTSTAPCPAETAVALTVAGLSRLLQVHGSSETAGLGWRDDPHGPYTLLRHWKRDTGEQLSRTSPSGDDAAAGSVVGVLPDKVEWMDQRRYRLGGRLDGAVQVGGINVFPHRVSEVLLRHPGVAASAVRLMRPSEGLRLKAFIVPRGRDIDVELLRQSLDAFATDKLSVAERPRAYSFGSVLPTDNMGKADDWQIVEAADRQPAVA